MNGRFLLLRLLLCASFLLSSAYARDKAYAPGRSPYTYTYRKQINLEEVMDSVEFRRAGISKLSKSERRALEQWLVLFLRKEIEGAHEQFAVVEDVNMNSSLLTLTDGSVWEVSPFDKNILRSWRVNQRIEFKGSGDVRGRIRLFNKETRTSVQAELRYRRPPDAKEGNWHKIVDMNRLGDHVTLDDGSVWKVVIFDKYKSRSWKTGHEIEVRGEFKSGQKALLYNRDLKESVQAEMLYFPRVRSEPQPQAEPESE